MTAPRTCRNCGSQLSPDIRWCPRCYEPVRELTPRAPLHEGDFVGSPVHERGDIPRWSRWEKTATTFGPRGRIIATAVLVLTIVPAIPLNGIVYVVTFPFFAAVVLREIWAKGWFVPDEEAAPAKPASPGAEEPSPSEPITVSKVLRWGFGTVALIAFAYGPIEIKASVLGFAAIALMIWFWRAFDYR